MYRPWWLAQKECCTYWYGVTCTEASSTGRKYCPFLLLIYSSLLYYIDVDACQQHILFPPLQQPLLLHSQSTGPQYVYIAFQDVSTYQGGFANWRNKIQIFSFSQVFTDILNRKKQYFCSLFQHSHWLSDFIIAMSMVACSNRLHCLL